jgi:copper transport protein
LLAMVGLVLWSVHRRASPTVSNVRESAITPAAQFMLLATLAYVFLNIVELNRDQPISEWGRILSDTTVGRLYAAELLLGLAALLLRSLNVGLRLVWAAIFLFAEAWSGHASVFQPVAYSVGLDFVHLTAASLWAGGLLLLLLVWRKERPEAGRFALLFSKWALLSFISLWVTGILSTLDFLPSLTYLLYTRWGTWLLVKAALSLVVAFVALFIRLRLSKGHLPTRSLLYADFSLLAAIAITVGVLTYQTPLPANEPLHYHQMGTDMHVTLRISPNSPGDNDFQLKIWLPEAAEPKQVLLRLQPLDKKNVGFIEVPIKAYVDQELDSFPGFTKWTYEAQGPYIPFAGRWKAQIRVTDANGDEKVRETTFRIY